MKTTMTKPFWVATAVTFTLCVNAQAAGKLDIKIAGREPTPHITAERKFGQLNLASSPLSG